MNFKTMNFLNEEKPKIVMFTGKGGVGKTTSSTSTAVHFALQGLRTLVISTDPTPSLSDILEVDCGKGVAKIEGMGELYAVELDYDSIVDLWIEKYGDEVYDLVSSFLPVERDILDYIAGAPGIDEEFALSHVYEHYLSGKYDVIVWDTAPAGGTLALLNLQDTFYSHMGEAAKLYVRVRGALKALTRGKPKKDPLKIIADWEKLAKNVLDMVRDEKTHAFIVAIPESLSINQSQRVINDLEKFGIQVSGIVLNNVLTEEASDNEFNKSRRNMQLKYINRLNEVFGEGMPVIPVPLMPFEVKGVEALKEVEKELFPSKPSP
jgi:arsenite-transporting ATPase